MRFPACGVSAACACSAPHRGTGSHH